MSIANKLYDRPHGAGTDAVDASNAPAMYITGSLPSVPTGDSYEGRLQIHNNIGACEIELIDGELPSGSTIAFDSLTNEIVIKWPGLKAATSDIPNGGFIAGDNGTWEKGPGWTITFLQDADGEVTGDPDDPSNVYIAQYYNQQGESDIISLYKAPVALAKAAGTKIHASCDVVQGKTSSNQAGAGVRIIFEDAVGNQVGIATGNIIKNSDEPTNQGWKTSSVDAIIPDGAVYARLGASAFRNHQNRALWVDNFKWDLVQASQGTVAPGNIDITLEATDSVGRHAFWSGSIVVVNALVEILNYFNTDLTTDETGRSWVLLDQTVTDRWGQQPVVCPFLDTTHIKEGAGSFEACPDTNTHDGTFDYFSGGTSAGVYTLWTADDAPLTDDFCIEMYVRPNLHSESGNSSHAFVGVGGSATAKATFCGAVRMGSTPVLENTIQGGVGATIEAHTKNPVRGQWFHWAMTRKDGAVKVWYNGELFKSYAASVWSIDPGERLLIGSAFGGSGSSLGWCGNVDAVRVTRGWYRYDDTFTPPPVPY